MSLDQAERSWGVYINQGYPRQPVPESCSAWSTPRDNNTWRKEGVIVWDSEAQAVEALSAQHALALLNHLRTTEAWKEEGIPILVQSTRLLIPEPKKKKSHKSEPETEDEIEKEGTDAQTVVEERFRLKPDAGLEFFAWLQANETRLQQMAKEDEEKKAKLLGRVYDFIFRRARVVEAEKFDLSSRQVSWIKDAYEPKFTCDYPPARGTVAPSSSNFDWQGWVERPDQFKKTSPPFDEIEEAFAWVEQELVKTEQAPDQAEDKPDKDDEWFKVELADLIAQKRTELAEYWLDPSDLEPKRITYRLIIELDYSPDNFKTLELSFGKQLRYNEEFATSTQLARELRLDQGQLEITQPLGRDNGWYRITSQVTYYREDVALMQAQQLWEKSLIVQKYKEGRVIRAWYGFEEVETEYSTILGACENPDKPYPIPESRDRHMAFLALGETLAYALDVDGYRALLGIPRKYASDEQLLQTMHKRRAQSSHIPQPARAESEEWLRKHQVEKNLK